MTDLHQIFDSLVGYLVGMTLVEVVVKPSLIRLGKQTLSQVDDHVGVVPDWLYREPSEQEPPFDR